jgi:hypothetical protein
MVIIFANQTLILDKTPAIKETALIMKRVSLTIISGFLTINYAAAQSTPLLPEGVVIEQTPAGAVVEATPVVPAAGPMPTTLTTLKGRTFEQVEVLKHDPDGLMFRHAKGMAKVPFADLSEEVQKRFNYKPETAAAFVKEHVDAEKEAKAKAEAARLESRERRMMEKTMRMQMELLRQQAALSAADGGYIIPGFADFGVPTYGYGAGIGLGFWPDLDIDSGDLLQLAKRVYQWDRDRLFGDYSTRSYIGPNAALYNNAVTNSNVRSFSTFGGYRYPTELAVRAGNPLIGHGNGSMGHRASMAAGERRPTMVRPMPTPAGQRLVPANSAGARIGGTGTLMQGGSNRISHQ